MKDNIDLDDDSDQYDKFEYYETDEGESIVIYSSKNPLAWIKSDTTIPIKNSI